MGPCTLQTTWTPKDLIKPVADEFLFLQTKAGLQGGFQVHLPVESNCFRAPTGRSMPSEKGGVGVFFGVNASRPVLGQMSQLHFEL